MCILPVGDGANLVLTMLFFIIADNTHIAVDLQILYIVTGVSNARFAR
jgi:hypothetical protein